MQSGCKRGFKSGCKGRAKEGCKGGLSVTVMVPDVKEVQRGVARGSKEV